MTQARFLTLADAQAAVLGGAVLGGGGGGSMQAGLEAAQVAIQLGDVFLKPVDEMPDNACLLTVSSVGAPAAVNRYVRPIHYLRAVELLAAASGRKAEGFITNECGGAASVNGWLQAAAFGLPLIDAPCNGRAHPTGVMGSMGLNKLAGYVSQQTAVGGNPHQGRYVEASVSGSLESAAALIRNASVQAGGLVAVARNPATAGYVKQHAAPGAISQCIQAGSNMLAVKDKGGNYVAGAVAEQLAGSILAQGVVGEVRLTTQGGFDVGALTIHAASGKLELTFWNEYMTCEQDGQRLATFPDLLTTLDAKTGWPLSTAEIAAGQEVALLFVPADKLKLGAGMRDPELFGAIEQAVAKPVISYSFR